MRRSSELSSRSSMLLRLSMVHLIVNRCARHLRSDTPLYETIMRAARDSGVQIHETRSLAELEPQARACVEADARAVILAGGDGSYMAGLSALERAASEMGKPLPPIALAPGGTVGTVARNWGFH